MLFPQLLDKLITETTSLSLPGFSVELCLSATIVAMLLMRLVNLDRFVPASVTAVFGAFAALVFTWLQFRQIGAADAIVSQKIFTGLLIHDTFTVFFRAFLSLFLLLTIDRIFDAYEKESIHSNAFDAGTYLSIGSLFSPIKFHPRKSST